jgi:hypothetical protein
LDNEENILMTRFHAALSALIIAACGFSAGAQAAQFTFHVPVQVANIPSLQMLSVSCSVMDGKNALLGSGNAVAAPLVNHGFSGTITIAFDAKPGIDPTTASAYDCYLTVSIIDSANKVETTGDGALATDFTKITGQKTTQVNGQAIGPIPH